MMMIWTFLKHNNLLPYIAIIGMGFWIYILWESNIQKDIQLEQEKVDRKSLTEAFAIQADYANRTIETLGRIQKEQYKEGKHVEILYYSNPE